MCFTIVFGNKTCSASESSSSTLLYLVRHGQTDWNVQKILQGQTDIPLNDAGRQEAAQLKEMLESIPFDACFSSDLQRAIETAHILCASRSLIIEVDPRLRERNFGPWEGHPASEIESQRTSCPETLNIENDEAIQNRVFPLLKQIAERHAGSHVLIVTHGGVIRSLLSYMLEYPCESLFDIRVKNSGILEITISDGKWEIQKMQGIEVYQNCLQH